MACLLLWGASAASAGGGLVALQSADRSCGDSSTNVYVDCGNGTVTDNRTGLVWLKKADCLAGVDWHTAMEFVAGLADLPGTATDDCGLSDGSSPGEWRLPTIKEWRTMVAAAEALGCSPTITSDQGDSCWSLPCLWSADCSFTGVRDSYHWSSTSSVADVDDAWEIDLWHGHYQLISKTAHDYVWPVRGGQ